MEILFCDRCKESIPDADLEIGRAVRVGSRLYHLPCALSRAMPGFGRTFLVLLVLAALGLSAWSVSRLLSKDEPKASAEVPAAWTAALSDALSKERRQAAEDLEKAVGTLRAELQKAVADAQQKIDRDQQAALNDAIRGLRERLDGVTDVHMKRFEADEQKLKEISDWAKEVKELAARLAANPPASAPATEPTPPTAPPGPAPTEPTPPPVGDKPEPPKAEPLDPEAKKAHDAEVDKWVKNLKDSSITIAYSAAFKLKLLKDPRAVPALTEALKSHKDVWVKAECATALGAIRSADAVPALIDALDDKDQYVLASVSDALVKITGQDFKSTLNPSTKERKAYKEQWSKWWKENEGDVRRRLGDAATPIPGMGG